MRLYGELFHPELAILPIGDHFTMDPRQAAYACEMLGYDRAELLELNVMDVARYAGAQEEYEELIASRVQAGTSELRRKDGTTFTFAYHAGETTLAGMTYYVAVGWPAE
jgi:PAS domain S-box-containing protein